ncbi:tyrosine-type recombinase/integrase [Promicromonospora kroppenstedtii]|uniref:Tyrosine-type recombinase/integrase n=1 Tax=Promicromonospora kroppenstedtii TaxID=440482 RepID=A0ABW7XLW2_9MICO
MTEKRGFGMVERRKNARTGRTTGFRARYVGPDTAKHSLTFTAKVDAEAWLSREEGLIARGEWTPPGWRAAAVSITVDQYAERNLALRHLSPRSREEYDRYRERFITDKPIGRAGLRSVTSLDVTAWLTDVRASTGPTMAARVYGFLSSIFNAALRDGLVDRSPCTVRGASSAPRASAKAVATPAEVAALLGHLPERYRVMVLLAAWSGLRSGELRNLRRRDVGAAGRTVSVHSQVQNLRGQGKVVRDVKTAAARRVVALPPAVASVLKEQLASAAQPGQDGLVFPSTVGTPISQSTFWEAWDKARRAIGRPDLRLHDLRTTAATLAAGTGATIAELMARLGHTTPNAAMRYQTAVLGADARIAGALDRLVVLPATPSSTSSGLTDESAVPPKSREVAA